MPNAPDPDRSFRLAALAHQIQRLERRVVPLQKLSNQVSWVRAGVLIIGVFIAITIGTSGSVAGGTAAFLITLLLFSLVVLYHRRLERWIQTFTLWRDLKADQIARLTLDWAKLPPPTALDLRSPCPLALDLDLTGEHSLHRLLDTTISRQGGQLLAEWLTQSHPRPEEIQTRQALVRELTPLSRFRNRFWLTFRLVLQEQLEGEGLVHWLAVEFPSQRLKWALPVATLLVAVNLVLFALYFWRTWPPFWVAGLFIYLAFYFVSQGALGEVFEAMVRLNAELDRFSAILRYLETWPCGAHPHLAQLCAPFRDRVHSPSAHIRRVKRATLAVGLRSNPVLGLVLNLILPWDFLAAYLSDRARAQVAQHFPEWVQVCYRLDALIALANFAHLHPEYTFPEFTLEAGPIFQAEKLGHPLIPFDQAVRNDFTVQAPGELVIITGSNMAGKSTFIKTVGTNLCLGYAGAPVDAARFRSAPFRLHTCIRISDSITDGFSYFYAEVKCLRRLLDELKTESPLPLLYLIDEIFRGTNNRERLLGSRAYIRTLIGRNGVGLLATHDLELATLAEQHPQVHNLHFRDRVADGKLVFDYKMRPGPCPTTNALKIMELEGLPVEPEVG
jgi:ABC-type multidrug transport system fused ATPase/permease subunit